MAISHDLAEIPDIRYWFLDENGMRAISLFVTGADSRLVNNFASELASQMQRIKGVSDVTAETSLDRPELRVRPRIDLTARLGISTESLAETIRVATIGDFSQSLAKFDTGDQQMPIRVQLDKRARADRQVLEQLRVPLPGGRGACPVISVANVQLDQGPTKIARYNRERQATKSMPTLR